MTTADRVPITPRLIIGLFILALGTLWTLDNLNVLDSEVFTRWWPLVLIAVGAVQFLNRSTNRVGPVLLIIAGVFLLFTSVLDYDFDLGDLIPFCIALFGAKLVWDALARRSARTGIANDDSTVHAFAAMAGVHWQSSSRAFRGGDANAIMGGVEITVPQGWRIVANVLPIMGGFEDKTSSASDTAPTLTVRGTVFMGAIVVKN